MNKRAKYLIDKLGLKKHPEGGYFYEHYRSHDFIARKSLKGDYNSERNYATAIFFLLEGDDFSSFHKIKSDEIWHLYEGSGIKLSLIDENEKIVIKELGWNLEKSQSPVCVIPQNTWFAAELTDKSSYALVGCTVSPGFDFEDFTLGSKLELFRQFPGIKHEIDRLTRG